MNKTSHDTASSDGGRRLHSHRLRAAVVAMTAVATSLPLILVAHPAAAEDSGTAAVSPMIAADCSIEEEKKIVDLGADLYRQRVVCSWVPGGVQAGWVGNWDVWTPGSAEGGAGTSNWGDWSQRSGVRTTVEYRVDPSGIGTECTSEIVKTKDVTFGYDEHAVKLTCAKIADGVKVRGTASFSLQGDTHTEWITAPATVQGPGKARNVPAMPSSRVDYELR